MAGVGNYSANLDVCRQVEIDIAQRNTMAEYLFGPGNRRAYWVIKGLESYYFPGIPTVPVVDAKLDTAAFDYSTGNYKQSFQDLCDAYARLQPAAQRQNPGS